MEIILKKDFESLGFQGDIVNVAPGYARNYLIPMGLAVLANNSNLKALEMTKQKIIARRIKDRESAERTKEGISQRTVTITRKAGEEDKLYGSVTSKDIAQELEREGVVIDRRKIVLEDSIKSLGETEVPIKLHPEVTGTLRVVVEREQEEEKE